MTVSDVTVEAVEAIAAKAILDGNPFIGQDPKRAAMEIGRLIAAAVLFGTPEAWVAVAPSIGDSWQEVASHGEGPKLEAAAVEAAEWLRLRGVYSLVTLGDGSAYGCQVRPVAKVSAIELWRQKG